MTLVETNIFNLDIEREAHVKDFFEFSKSSKSKNSIYVYVYAWKRFSEWCEENKYDKFSPPKDSFEFLLGLFISSMAKTRSLKSASIRAYIAGIKHFYEERGIELDVYHKEIKKTVAGINRELGVRQVTKKPLTAENIKLLIDSMYKETAIDKRDKALILIGFYGAFRRSELVNIDIKHLSFDQYGLSIFLPHSKTDQTKEGRHVDIPHSAREDYCPVRALRDWIHSANIKNGPVFIQVHKSGRVCQTRLSGQSIALILKKRCKRFGFSDEISGHSLRAGHVTSAIKAGTPESWIMRQTGHKTIKNLRKYERMQREFEANSAAKIQM